MPRVSLTDIANAVGVSKATVSMALRNHPEISEATATRVREAAKKLGYKPDPYMSRIAAARWRAKGVSAGSTLAFVGSLHPDHLELIPSEGMDHPTPFLTMGADKPEWTQYLPGHLQFQGAWERAEKMGYSIQYFLCKPGENVKSLSHNLFHRGIEGIMLSPVFNSKFIQEFQWGRFACVSIADHYFLPPTDFVVPKLSSHIFMVFRELFKKGYKRPGMVLYHERIQHLNNHILRGVFLSLCETVGFGNDVPDPFYIDHHHLDDVEDWISKEKPDVIIGFNDFVYHTIISRGYHIPEDFAFISLATRSDKKGQISGVQDPDRMMGKVAVEVLDQKLRIGDIGPSETRTFHTIQTKWIEGQSVPPVKKIPAEARRRIDRQMEMLNIFSENSI